MNMEIFSTIPVSRNMQFSYLIMIDKIISCLLLSLWIDLTQASILAKTQVQQGLPKQVEDCIGLVEIPDQVR